MDTEKTRIPEHAVEPDTKAAPEGGASGLLKILTISVLVGVATAFALHRGSPRAPIPAPNPKHETAASNTISAGVATKQKVKELQDAGEKRNAEVESFFK